MPILVSFSGGDREPQTRPQDIVKPLIVSVWTQLRAVGLWLLSVGLSLDHLASNTSIIKLRMAIFRGPSSKPHLQALGCVLHHRRMCTVF